MAAREAWFEAQPDLDPERPVFIDETGLNTKMARLSFALGRLNGTAALVHQCRDPVELLDDAALFVEGRKRHRHFQKPFFLHSHAVCRAFTRSATQVDELRGARVPLEVVGQHSRRVDVEAGKVVANQSAV